MRYPVTRLSARRLRTSAGVVRDLGLRRRDFGGQHDSTINDQRPTRLDAIAQAWETYPMTLFEVGMAGGGGGEEGEGAGSLYPYAVCRW